MSDNLNNGLLDDNSQEVEQSSDKEQDEQLVKIFDKLIEFFTGLTNEERRKQKKLKDIAKSLKKSKEKYYLPKKELVTASLGQKLYEIFRQSQNFEKYFDIKKHPKSIKLYLFEIFSTKNQIKIRDELTEEKIDKIIKSSHDVQVAINKIKSRINQYAKEFSHDVVTRINSTYNMLSDLSYLISFDWVFLLRKFDADISESNFNYSPEFDFIEGKYIIEELIVINDYIESVDFNRDWKNLIDYVKKITEDESMQNVLKKLINNYRVIKRDNKLLKIIRLINKDPYFKPKLFTSKSTIVQDYIMNFQGDIKGYVEKSLKELKKIKIEKLLFEIFHSKIIIRLKFYSEKLNELLLRKNIAGFKYIEPMNYLKAFLLDFCKGQIKSRFDFLIIKGTWCTHSKSAEYSALLDRFNVLTDEIVEFDNNLSEEESYGKNIRKMIFAVSHDSSANMMVKKVVYKVDGMAMELIKDSIKTFVITANKIKDLLQDYKATTPEIVIDFHKIPWDFPEDFDVEMTEIYKKLFNFINLIKFVIKENK